MTLPSRVYVLTAINWEDFDIIATFEGLTDAMEYADQLISLAWNRDFYRRDWEMAQADPRWDLFIRSFTKVADSGPYLRIEEHRVVPWSKSAVVPDTFEVLGFDR